MLNTGNNIPRLQSTRVRDRATGRLTRRHHRQLLLVLAISSAGLAQADVLEPAKMHAGGMALEPTLAVSQTRDDNLYHDADDAQAFWVRITTLQLKGLAERGSDRYGFDYRGEAGYVESSPADDYADHSTTVRGLWELTPRHHLQVEGAYLQEHDRRGAEYVGQDLEGELLADPARFHQGSLFSRYSYGAEGARGRLELELKGADKSYSNLREITRQSDYSDIYGTGIFYWRLGGQVQALLEARQGQVNYRYNPAEQAGVEDSLDSEYAAWLTGATWQLAGKTRGTVKFGHASKNFTDEDREDFSGTSWSGEVAWKPRSYSEVVFSTGRRTDESNGRGDYIDATDWGVDWRHGWTDRLESRFRYLQSNETYERDPQGRDDDITRYAVNLDYALRRWLVLGVFSTRDRYDSTLAEFDYPRNVAGFQMRASL